MTEQQWLECTDPRPMLEYFGEMRLEPRLRRLAVECCRRVRHLITEEVFRTAADAGEAFADDPRNKKNTIKAIAQASIIAWGRMRQYELSADSNQFRAACSAVATCASTDQLAALNAMRAAAQAVNRTDANCCDVDELQHQAALIRDIFGNPFCPVPLGPDKLDPRIKAVVQSMYDNRNFQEMPQLADALVDSGCTSTDILSHCRSEGPHVRGRWVVDLLLGKG
jgi:hypothetical protein